MEPARRKRGFYQEGDYVNSNEAIFKLFCYSLAMFVLPIASYMATTRIAEHYFHIPYADSYIWAVVVAVVVTNLVIAAYVWQAFKEVTAKTTKDQ